MYSSFISVRSDNSQEVNKRYIKSLEDQIKIREQERLQLIKKLQKAQIHLKLPLIQNSNFKPDNSFQHQNEQIMNKLIHENKALIQVKDSYNKLKNEYEQILQERDYLKKINAQMVSSLILNQKEVQIKFLETEIKEKKQECQLLQQELRQLKEQNKILKQKINKILFEKSQNSNLLNKNNEEQLKKLKYKLQDQQKRLEYQRKNNDTLKIQITKILELHSKKNQEVKLVLQLKQKGFKNKIESLQKSLFIQRTQFLQKIQQYQKIINSRLLVSKTLKQDQNSQIKTLNSNKQSNQIRKSQNLLNIQSEQRLLIYKQKIQSLQNQLKQENKRLNILEQSNHELRRQLMMAIQKEENIRKTLIQERKRSKSRQYFLEKEKNLKISQKYLNKSRSKDSRIQNSRISQKKLQKVEQKKQDNLSKIRKGIIGSYRNQQLDIKNPPQSDKNDRTQSLNDVSVLNSFQKSNTSKQYLKNLRFKQIKENQNQKTIKLSQEVQKKNKFTLKNDIIVESVRQRVQMIKANNQQDISYSQYRISAQKLQEKEDKKELKNIVRKSRYQNN